MRIRVNFTGLALAFLVVTLGIPLAASADARSTYQTADFHTFPDGVGLVGGAGTMFRSKKAVDVRLATSGLDTNSSYTVWWVVWNDPSACATNPCGLGDLGISDNSVFYAAGFVTGDDGTANLTVHLNSGKLPDGITVLIPGGLHKGNGFDAEIHMIVQSHGSILPGVVSEQIGMFMGACNPVCVDQIAIAFLPTEKPDD
jgi:hypothetical protein